MSEVEVKAYAGTVLVALTRLRHSSPQTRDASPANHPTPAARRALLPMAYRPTWTYR